MADDTDTSKTEINESVPPQEPDERTAPVTPGERKSVVAILKADPWYNDVQQLVLWKDPVRSGVVFGIINFFYFLIHFYDYTVVTLLAYLGLSLSLVTLAYANFVVLKAKWVQGKTVENPFKERFKDAKFHISKKTVEQHLNTVVDIVNVEIDHLREVFYATDSLLTLQCALYFYLAATIGGWFSGATLLYLASLVVFLWPKLYQEKKKEIDHFYGIAKVEADKYFQLALEKLPPAVHQRFPALAPKEKKNQ
jgi:hypothetical protein